MSIFPGLYFTSIPRPTEISNQVSLLHLAQLIPTAMNNSPKPDIVLNFQEDFLLSGILPWVEILDKNGIQNFWQCYYYY